MKYSIIRWNIIVVEYYLAANAYMLKHVFNLEEEEKMLFEKRYNEKNMPQKNENLL